MSDRVDNEEPRSRWNISIDLRDVLAVIGVAAAVVGAAAFHWGAALFLVGSGVAALAFRAAR